MSRGSSVIEQLICNHQVVSLNLTFGSIKVMKKRRQKFKEIKSSKKHFKNIRLPIAPEEQVETQKKKYNRSQEKREWREELEEYMDI